MIARSGLLTLLAFALFATLPAFAETLLRDDFSMAQGRYEFVGGRAWKIGGGQCRFASPGRESFAVANLDELSDARVEATLTLEKRLSPSYITAGLTFYQDPENHWRLLLVAAPDNKPYFELIERYAGTHQAQSASASAGTQLAAKDEGDLKVWEYDRPYRLILTISPKAITGEVRDPATGQFWRRAYSFATGRAVRAGRPGMMASGTEGGFRELIVEGVRPAPAPSLSVKRGPAGSVAILRDEANKLAPTLQEILTKAGFGATVLEWDDLSRGRLPTESLDLLVLANARRLPATVVKPMLTFLRTKGKVICIGAPAFGELLIKTPHGYVSTEKYGESVYDSLAKRAMPLTATGWKRVCKNAERVTSIQAEPKDVWKVTADLDGWDSFSHALEKGFPEGNNLLCFRAKGDASTPQLSIECDERDGARWIATVDLSTDWRAYVLRPYNFAFWHDSKAKRGPGSVLNPANIESVHFGLSGSHTPKCKPGPHTFWFADVATAADPNMEEPDVRIPDIEGLCPSYKLYPLSEIASLRVVSPLQSAIRNPQSAIPFTGKGYSPVWREGGIGFDRDRAWRWVRVLDAYDATGRNRGALVSFMLGENVFAGGIWANVGLAEPSQILNAPLQDVLVSMAKAMTRGCFLLEAGTRYFSYQPGEKMDLGALVMNSGHEEGKLSVAMTISDGKGAAVCQKSLPLTIPPGERRSVQWEWTPSAQEAGGFPFKVTTELLTPEGAQMDIISHTVELLPDKPASPDEFVKVEGSNFRLGGKPWYMLGINYRPSSMAGNSLLGQSTRRESYDPVIIERDLAWMESAGINMLSAIQALIPDDPDAPGAYRDQLDFLNRCRNHGMKVFYFLPWGNPMAGADVEKIKKHIEAAGIKDHPAILSWELAWEPIYYSGTSKRGGMDFLIPDWNAWIVGRYGSIEEAEKDWAFKVDRTDKGLVALPKHEWCDTRGPWDRAVAAFRRFFSDRVGRGYGDIIRELHRWDPKHLVTFRFGACGIPNKSWYAHAHSAAVAKHVDFLCPEGYNLHAMGSGKPAPADDLRKGGMVTLYYRFLSREKPVVWMEFGYTVNGIHDVWKTGREHISPEQLASQREDYENFYKMFIESGARGSAPWWLPGGFRLGENSDFGVLEPDGTERPACQVLREFLPKFAQVKQGSCVLPRNVLPETGRVIELDLDAHYADAWDLYSAQYLEAVKSGELPYLKTAGTGTTSADCPLLAVGDVPCTGKNPPQFLNAEFNSVELKVGDGEWKQVRNGEVFTVKNGAKIMCRASVGNTAEAAWVASSAPATAPEGLAPGAVYLACAGLYPPIASNTDYLKDAEVKEFALPTPTEAEQKITFVMLTVRKKTDSTEMTLLPFGEKWTVTLKRED
jgi:hypothetical protein